MCIIDSIDGTINFSRQDPNFAISVAFAKEDKVLLGVIYRPLQDELYWALEKGKSAFCNNKKIGVSKLSRLDQITFACDWVPNIEKRKEMLRILTKSLPKVRQIKSMGSAVSDMAKLAKGGIDAYINFGLKPWDVAAASLIIEKAGGKVTTINGERFTIFSQDIVAANPYIYEQVMKLK